ncbi:MAG: 1-acyl-sn-glycerol-3-phosphate acyltransferase [Bacilli bacterium]|nr:1-acyl-sn-glycerol-3-phosphate acyltransferase [Bacilli bacterium]
MSKQKNQLVLKRHRFYSVLFRPIMALFNLVAVGCKVKTTKLKKGENVLVLSNHQTDLDPVIMYLSFNKPMYLVATDTLLSNGGMSKFLRHTYSPLPKKKGMSDIQNVMDMIRVAKEGGSIALFPEGNRTYAEFQFPIDVATVKLIRKLKLPVLLYNIKGGNGVMPRFFFKRRKGKFTGEVVKRLEVDEYSKMSDDELLAVVKDTIKVYDSESGELYKSKNRAMYMENMFHVCPKCGSVSKLHSEGNYLTCSECGLKVEYTEDLHLKSDDESFKYTKLIEWYDMQKEWTRNYELKPGETIFEDEGVKLYQIELYKKRRLVIESKMALTNEELIFGHAHFKVSDIIVASPIGGRRMSFTCNGKNYLIMSNKRFNPLKYILMLNKLDSGIKRIGYDHNYSL